MVRIAIFLFVALSFLSGCSYAGQERERYVIDVLESLHGIERALNIKSDGNEPKKIVGAIARQNDLIHQSKSKIQPYSKSSDSDIAASCKIFLDGYEALIEANKLVISAYDGNDVIATIKIADRNRRSSLDAIFTATATMIKLISKPEIKNDLSDKISFIIPSDRRAIIIDVIEKRFAGRLDGNNSIILQGVKFLRDFLLCDTYGDISKLEKGS